MDLLHEFADFATQPEPAPPAKPLSDSDSSSTSESDDDLFFGPMAGPSIAEKRAKWKKLLGEGTPFQAGRRKKRRKTEEKPRKGRYSYLFNAGDPQRFRLDPSSTKATGIASASPPRRVLFAGVYATVHVVRTGAQAAVSSLRIRGTCNRRLHESARCRSVRQRVSRGSLSQRDAAHTIVDGTTALDAMPLVSV